MNREPCREHDSRDEAHGSASVTRGQEARRDRRRYEPRDGRGRAKQDARAESNAWSNYRAAEEVAESILFYCTLHNVSTLSACYTDASSLIS